MRNRILVMRPLAASSTSLAVLLTTAHAQTCFPTWRPGSGVAGLSSFALGAAAFDPDGAGPLGERLVCAGNFNLAGDVWANRAAAWDGQRWSPLGGGPGTGGAVIVFDEDGPGPAQPRLICGGAGVKAWTGRVWADLGLALEPPDSLSAFCALDPDGPGPQPSRLVAAINRSNTRQVVMLENGQWLQLGGTLPSASRSIRAFDPDQSGPEPARLIYASLSVSGAAAAYQFDGTSWLPMTPLGVGSGACLALWRPPGSPHPQLAIGASFQQFPGVGIILWDGQSAQPIPLSPQGTEAMTAFDPDGPGPATEMLAAASSASQAGFVSTWDGAQWTALPGAFRRGAGTPSFYALAPFRPAASQAPHLAAVGYFDSVDGQRASNVAIWTGASWTSAGRGVTGAIFALAPRPDVQGAQVYAGGTLDVTGDEPLRYIGRWDGERWRALGEGVDAPVRALAHFDPDGPGPALPRLIAAGDFTTAGAAPARHIAAWDGAAWEPLGQGLPDAILAVAPARDQAGQPILVAASLFFFNDFNVPVAARLDRWDGAAWAPMPMPTSNIYTLRAFDPDPLGGPGPALYAGTSDGVHRWTGAAWQRLGPAFVPIEWHQWVPFVLALGTHDSDGPGPGPARLLAGGLFGVPGTGASRVAAWNGSAWEHVAPGLLPGYPRTLLSADLDADGADELLAAGEISSSSPNWPVFSGVARLGPSGWEPMIAPDNLIVASVAVDPDGSGPRPASAYFGGHFRTVQQLPSAALAQYACPPAPACYPNCDGSTTPPILTISDFSCFLQRYAAADPWSNCDGSTAAPILTVADFTCFLQRYAVGCP